MSTVESKFPFPYASLARDSVFLGQSSFMADGPVYLACSTYAAGVMDIEVTSGFFAPEMCEEMALSALGPSMNPHFERKHTHGGMRIQWKTLYVNLGQGRKGVVKCSGKKIVQQELTVARKKTSERGGAGVSKKKKNVRVPGGLGVPNISADIKRQLAQLTRY